MRGVARLVIARPLLILLAGVVLTGVSLFVTVQRFNVVNNTSDLLSDKSQAKEDYNEFLKDFGSDSRFIVLIQSPDVQKNRQAADDVGQYLQTLKPHVAEVLYKIDFSSVKPRLLFTRDVTELNKIAQELESDISSQQKGAAKTQQMALDLNSILAEANQKFNDKYLRKKENWTEFKPFVARFVSILNKVSDQAEGKSTAPSVPKDSDEADSFDNFDSDELIAQHEYFSLKEGQALLVFAYPGEPDPDADTPFSDTVKTIRAHLVDLQAKYPGMTLELTGEPALDADEIASASSDSFKATMITLTLIVALFVFSYRAIMRPAFAFITLLMAVTWTFGFAFVVVGHLNILSVAVIPMVLGIGIDFGIQILGRYEEELNHGRTVPEAIAIALEHTGVAIITGGSTTAVAFFTLCFNDFVGLSELGEIASASMILCIAANLVLLPAIFILRDRHRSTASLQAQSSNSAWNFIHNWDHSLVRTPRLWIVVAALVSIASLVSLPRLSFDYNLLHLQNPSAPATHVLYEVMDASKDDETGDEVSTIYSSVVADNVAQARELRTKLLALPEVARVDSPLDLLPEDEDKKKPVIERIVKAAAALNIKPSTDTPADIPKARADVKSLLAQAREGLKQATGWAGVNKIAKDAVAAFGAMIPALERTDKALNSAPLATIRERFSASSTGAFTRLQKNMEMLRTQKADHGLTLADLPPQLQKLFVAPDGKILLQVYGKQDLWERAPDEEFTKAVLSVAPRATGTPILNDIATKLLRDSYLAAAVWAFAAIVVLIFLHFQSFKYLLLTITPLVLAVLWRTGAMVWLGISFNPANIVTLPLIIGIDVAFGVYIIDRYREDGRLSIFSGSTGKAIIMSTLTSLFGFSSLLVSNFTGMFSIGELMSLGIAIGLITSIFFLPQILALLHPDVPRNPDGTPINK